MKAKKNTRFGGRWMEELRKSLEQCEDCLGDLVDPIVEAFGYYFCDKMQAFKIAIDNRSLQIIRTQKSHNAFQSKFSKPAESIICVFGESIKNYDEATQYMINAIGEYFDEDGDMGKRSDPFELCHDDVRPYILKVLDRLVPEKKQVVQNDLDSGSLQIISSHINKKEDSYFTVKFSKPVKSIIYINWRKLEKKTDDDKIYSIAHEIGHFYTGDGESWLLEKEANDWLKTWGEGRFDDLIEKINYQAPKLEEEGCKKGYEWAKHMNKNDLLKYYKNDLDSLNEDGLNKKEKFKIIKRIKNKLFNHFKKENMLENGAWHESYLNGFSFGVMERVREIS